MSLSAQPIYKVVELRDRLRTLNLPIAGSKSELLRQLHEAEPDGGWMESESKASGVETSADDASNDDVS